MKTKAAQMLAPDLLARKATGKPSCCLLSGSPAGTCPCWLLHVTTIQLISWDLSKIDGGLGWVAGRIVYTSCRDHHRSHLCWGRGSDEHADQDSPPHTHARSWLRSGTPCWRQKLMLMLSDLRQVKPPTSVFYQLTEETQKQKWDVVFPPGDVVKGAPGDV